MFKHFENYNQKVKYYFTNTMIKNHKNQKLHINYLSFVVEGTILVTGVDGQDPCVLERRPKVSC